MNIDNMHYSNFKSLYTDITEIGDLCNYINIQIFNYVYYFDEIIIPWEMKNNIVLSKFKIGDIDRLYYVDDYIEEYTNDDNDIRYEKSNYVLSLRLNYYSNCNLKLYIHLNVNVIEKILSHDYPRICGKMFITPDFNIFANIFLLNNNNYYYNWEHHNDVNTIYKFLDENEKKIFKRPITLKYLCLQLQYKNIVCHLPKTIRNDIDRSIEINHIIRQFNTGKCENIMDFISF